MTTRERPRGLLRLFLRMPALLYHGQLAAWMGRRLLVLTTRGRRTGRPRVSGLNYAVAGETVYVIAGYGPSTDWYRNLRADPRVEVRVGRRRWPALARTITDPDERRRGLELLRRSALQQGPPRLLRPLVTRLGLDYDAEVRAFDANAAGMPLVALRPAPV